jgi:hypothetical protein
MSWDIDEKEFHKAFKDGDVDWLWSAYEYNALELKRTDNLIALLDEVRKNYVEVYDEVLGNTSLLKKIYIALGLEPSNELKVKFEEEL